MQELSLSKVKMVLEIKLQPFLRYINIMIFCTNEENDRLIDQECICIEGFIHIVNMQVL